jgi:hypothetical protein
VKRLLHTGLCAALVAACASGPTPPEWQGNARSAIDAAVDAALQGETRAEALAYARARDEAGRTGDPALLARLALMRCAAHAAALAFGPCTDYEVLREDAAPAERAYAAHLAGKPLARDDIARLPPAQQGAAAAIAAGADPAASAVQAIDDPLSRLIAAAALFQAGRASPQVIAVAADTASAQGWRRPVLAWLGVQASLAQRAGDGAEAARLLRRVQAATPAARGASH